MGHAAAAIEADALEHPNADGLVHGQIQPAQGGDQLAVRADSGAAADQGLAHALEDRDVPADPAQRVRDEEACDRAADHQRATRHALSSP